MFLKSILAVLLISVRFLSFAAVDTLPAGITSATIPGDFADPSVVRYGNVFYATGTSSEWAPHFPLFISTNMWNWKQIGYVFIKKPEWAATSFWAPELFYHRGLFYVYYVAKRKSDSVSCIGVATAKDPSKGFTDQGIVVAYGKEAIDPFVFRDGPDLYISFKAYGLDKRPIEILGAKLSPDGLKMVGEPFTMLRDDARQGLEGQAVIKRYGFWYLLYSAGNCCGLKCSYNVRVARAAFITGPYEDYERNPILTDNEEWKCPGHGTIVNYALGKYAYMFHAYNKKDDVFTGRQGMLKPIIWDTLIKWPYIEDVTYFSKFTSYNIYDKFNTLPHYFQWDFRHNEPEIKLRESALLLSGKTDSGNQTGTAVTVRAVRGDYEMQTAVVNTNSALKGLVLYGDADRAVGIGIKDSTLQLWQVKNNVRTILAEQLIDKGIGRLKMVVANGYQCRFYCTIDNTSWIELKASDAEYYDASFLPPWDRSPRPGLLHYGSMEEPAAFTFFSIEFK